MSLTKLSLTGNSRLGAGKPLTFFTVYNVPHLTSEMYQAYDVEARGEAQADESKNIRARYGILWIWDNSVQCGRWI
jgi:hypothetical protein